MEWSPNRKMGGVRAPGTSQSTSGQWVKWLWAWKRKRQKAEGPCAKSPMTTKEDGMKRTKRARSRRNKQINKAGEGEKPPE
jgi:hypothetical protein